ncbi:starch phosphorylase [Maridesulfovibrio ferrireducens]|uniref:Starch phosphorylase n=1 Tax=Maridesulfovibrio ferrireducens TaxID=246191 RepID=A0A1G9HP11_9BACT|nr:alpha-glucan family phosphorylase [Maridesulfovibrio ferrireducens]SDL14670.1 starch phosphorylase [Maridesulfovibrio ferrireducens]
MQPLRVYSVVPRLPKQLEKLWDLAYNFLFVWNNDISSIFSSIDQVLWRDCQQNPVAFLNNMPQKQLEELATDVFFIQRLNEAVRIQSKYLSRASCSYKFEGAKQGEPVVAYFSLEYGIGLSLPIYSGGLGILAGDHLKSSSDLNIPLVGIGLCYQHGYFRQYMTQDGWQQERYPSHDFEEMPIKPAKNEKGEDLKFTLEMKGEPLHVKIWKVDAGRVTLYLLDTNISENTAQFKAITARLYGGNLEMRLWQEILLGVGGVKALAALGLEPSVIHMNEGHSAFAGLERIRVFMTDHGLSFEAAMEMVASSSIFTTHTPVPAGNDRFPADLMRPYFEPYAQTMGLAYKVFLALGREDPRDDSELFCMTVLALKLSRFNNGVSKLHGQVSRNMWQKVWPQYPVEDVPIGAITNGVHMPTWVANDISLLFDRYLGTNWREDPDCVRTWRQVDNIPDAELWRTHERLREQLVDFVRKRLRKQLLNIGARRKEIELAEEALDPRALTIGFARRFATYKRAGLLLKDKERLVKLISDTRYPVQFIFAGKAHPQDNEGKKLIQELIQFCRREECRMSMVFLEDYDMKMANYLVQGCDVWLNTPRRPLEACGTSGMKAMANGVLQFSTPDGWWDEAYLPDNSLGWAIGRREDYNDHEYQDFVESQTLYKVLENDIIPDFYDRGHGSLPRSWVTKVKAALCKLGPEFNANRMVEDYTEKAYLPAFNNYKTMAKDEFKGAKDLAAWRMELMTKWSSLKIRNIVSEVHTDIYVQEPIIISAEVFLNGLNTEDVQVEIYAGPVSQDREFIGRKTIIMTPEESLGAGWHLYQGEVLPSEAGRFGYTVRILPHHELLLDPHSLGLIHWAQ